MATIRLNAPDPIRTPKLSVLEVGGQAVLGRQLIKATPWHTERHGYDPTLNDLSSLGEVHLYIDQNHYYQL